MFHRIKVVVNLKIDRTDSAHFFFSLKFPLVGNEASKLTKKKKDFFIFHYLKPNLIYK